MSKTLTVVEGCVYELTWLCAGCGEPWEAEGDARCTAIVGCPGHPTGQGYFVRYATPEDLATLTPGTLKD